MEENGGSRNLWAEVRASDNESRRKLVEVGGRALYAFIIVIGGLLALDLYTRPEAQIIKIFGVLAAIALVVSDVFWAWATHHSSAGGQRWVARAFWSLGVAIYALNLIAEYQHYLGVQMSSIVGMWYWSASVVTVVEAAVGWALYLMLSPEQKLSDVAAKAKSDAVTALMRGIEKPDERTAEAFNKQVRQASLDLAHYAGMTVSQHVGGLVYGKNGKEKAALPEPPKSDRPNG